MFARPMIVSAFMAVFLAAPPVLAQQTEAAIEAATTVLAQSFPADDLQDMVQTLESAPDGFTGATLGQLYFMDRQFDRAAWAFGVEALADPDNPVVLSNFSTMLVQTFEDDRSPSDPGFPDAAVAASQAADTLLPGQAYILNALANAYRAEGQFEAAVAAARAATELAPDEPLYLANLAAALAAMGDNAGAAAALARIHAMNPNNPDLHLTLERFSNIRPAYAQSVANQCNVDFRCQEICPRSIIGGLQSVTCEMENMSAQMACQEGRPYPVSFDCSEDLPEYGILIPGLNAGFSISAPGVQIHVLVDGDGTVNVRATVSAGVGRVGVFARGDAHFSPSNGVSFSNMGGGTRFNVLPSALGGGSEVDRLVGQYGHGVLRGELQATTATDGVEFNGEVYNLPLDRLTTAALNG